MPGVELIQQHAMDLLHQMIGADQQFRAGQWEAIEAVAVKKQRALVVQRTGWGKSLVYFLATRLLREGGAGPTLLISPLLSLMRNQIEMAARIGIRAVTINSSNQQEWASIEESLSKDECDLMLISPERLNNQHFLKHVLPRLSGHIGLFVVDEAHCISDWGHDFRPDYRRIVRILQSLPRNIPVLGTTATANNRVVEDIQSQLGPGLTILRGPLTRESLRLQNIQLAGQSERLAWLAQNLPKFKEASGIIYCLTVADTEKVADWLKRKGFSAEAYHAGHDGLIDRQALEDQFLRNDIKILVATVALGMGFDKPDIGFVIHYQRPGSVVAYYQQVGRAGRGVDRSYGILLNGAEDDEIQNYFIDSAFPSMQIFQDILQLLEKHESLSLGAILAEVNTRKTMAEKALRLLELDGAVGQLESNKVEYFRTPNPWKPEIERTNRILELRRKELAQMQSYVTYPGCLMEFLQKALDDSSPHACKRCANCQGKGFSAQVAPELVIEAETFLKGAQVIITPHKFFPAGLFTEQRKMIPRDYQNAPGRALCYYGDVGWGKWVKTGKYEQGYFPAEMVEASARLIQDLWKPDPFPTWVTAIPSHRRPTLVADFASQLAAKLGLPFIPALRRTIEAPEQKTMYNSAMQSRNAVNSLGIEGKMPDSPALLVDDIIDSGWTLTMAGYLLRQNGSGLVYPFALAQAYGANGGA